MASNKDSIKSGLARRCMRLKGNIIFNKKPLRSTTEAVGVGSSRAKGDVVNRDSSDVGLGVDRHRVPNNESNKLSIQVEGVPSLGAGETESQVAHDRRGRARGASFGRQMSSLGGGDQTGSRAGTACGLYLPESATKSSRSRKEVASSNICSAGAPGGRSMRLVGG